MKVNVAYQAVTHEGGKAVQTTPYEQLKRTVLACMLFEDSFYEDGKTAVERIKELCAQCTKPQIFTLALLASDKYHLRHIPLQLIVEGIKHKDQFPVIDIIDKICKRPDQMTDLLALYWKDGRKPIANQLKRGLAQAFQKFDEYQLAKYNRDNPIKLRDILFLTHAKPKDKNQEELWKRLVNKELKTPDTWEVRLSSGADKKQSFVELLAENKLGKLAILRNMRNMRESGVDKNLVSHRLLFNIKEMLPFQYLAAARECPEWEDIIDPAMIASSAFKPKLPGKTIVLVDVSGSMEGPISNKSKMLRYDAACGLAILLRECCPDIEIYSFSDNLKPVPARHGVALRDAIINSQPHGGTYIGQSLMGLMFKDPKYDRLIIITDEQAHDDLPRMPKGKNYILNIAGYQNGIGEKNSWVTITGFSEASIDFIRELESVE